MAMDINSVVPAPSSVAAIDGSTVPATVDRRKDGWLNAIGAAILRHRERHARDRHLIELSRHDAHMLGDMGIDPRDVTDALNRRSISMLFHPLRGPK